MLPPSPPQSRTCAIDAFGFFTRDSFSQAWRWTILAAGSGLLANRGASFPRPARSTGFRDRRSNIAAAGSAARMDASDGDLADAVSFDVSVPCI